MANNVDPYINAGTGLVTGIVNNLAADVRAKKQREWDEEMWNKQNDWSLMMWNKTNEYNSPLEQVKRMQDAGLNPLYYGLDGSSANGIEAAQPMQYERASDTIGLSNPYEDYMSAKMQDKQIEVMNKQIDKINSDIRNQDADTEGVILDNEFKEKTMNARVEAEDLANKLTKKQMEKIDKEKEQIEQNIKKLIAETDNEIERKALIQAETNLKNMSAKQITELLPYQKNLMAAQTEAQKAAAAASFANAAYQRGLISNGYIELMCDKLREEAGKIKAEKENAEAMAAINNFKQALRNGTIFNPNETNNPLFKFSDNFMNNFFSGMSMIAEVITGPLAGILK